MLAKNEAFHATDKEFRVVVERELREMARKQNSRRNNSRGKSLPLNSLTEEIRTEESPLWEAIIGHQNKLRVDAENLREQLKALPQVGCHDTDGLRPYLAKLLESIPDHLSEKLPAAELSSMVHRAHAISLQFLINDFVKVCSDKEKASSLKKLVSIIGQPRKCYEVLVQMARTNSQSFSNLVISPLPTPEAGLRKGKWDYAKTITSLGKYKKGSFDESKLQGDRKTNIQKFNEFRKPNLKVHAEIQVVIYVASHGYLSDPEANVSDYIGCNKDTCFLCDRSLRKHKSYRMRGCHNHIFNGWRVPDTICCQKEEADKIKVALDETLGILKDELCCEW